MVFSVLKSPKFLGHPTKVGKNMAFQITERVTE
jgi:flagellar motor switch protein FliM